MPQRFSKRCAKSGSWTWGDHFTFVFGDVVQDLEAAPYGGARFSVDARLSRRSFVRFHLDVSTGDVLGEPYESLSGRDWLGFAGVASTGFRAVSPEEQRGTEEGEEFKPIRRGWCLGEEKFREELLTQMSERMGAERYGEERAETAEALAELIIAEELKLGRWQEADLKTRP